MEENAVDAWQSRKSSVTERTTYLFNNEFRSDIRFVIGKKPYHERFVAHKLILSIGSCVFADMFNDKFGSHVEEVEVHNVEPSAFLNLLRYLYTDTSGITDDESAISTLYVAKKYKVLSLQAECIKFLSNNLSYDNVILILAQARLYNELLLEERCWEIIDNNPLSVFENRNLTNIDLDTLCLILDRDSLYVKEVELFKGVLKWSVAECERQKLPSSSHHQKAVLGRALEKIRFPLMTPKEFARFGIPSGLFSNDEIISIFLCVSEGTKNSTNFIDRPRKPFRTYEHSTVY